MPDPCDCSTATECKDCKDEGKCGTECKCSCDKSSACKCKAGTACVDDCSRYKENLKPKTKNYVPRDGGGGFKQRTYLHLHFTSVENFPLLTAACLHSRGKNEERRRKKNF
uniref:Uncharacterized protein n=1 Tax=Strigamia maritima TaxID=126957 RepID=T1J3Z3_STRMM